MVECGLLGTRGSKCLSFLKMNRQMTCEIVVPIDLQLLAPIL